MGVKEPSLTALCSDFCGTLLFWQINSSIFEATILWAVYVKIYKFPLIKGVATNLKE